MRELAKSNGMTVEELSGELNYPYTTLEKALKLLEVDGAVEREGSKYLRTANRWRPDVARAAVGAPVESCCSSCPSRPSARGKPIFIPAMPRPAPKPPSNAKTMHGSKAARWWKRSATLS